MDDKRSSAVWIVAAMLLVLLLPLLYVLSIGPMAAYYQGQTDPHWAKVFYSPLAWLVRNSKTAESCLLWYLGFWIPVP